MTIYTDTIYRAHGTELIRTVQVEVMAAWTASTTNYWTFALRHVRADGDLGQQYGELVAWWEGNKKSLAANDPFIVYSNEVGGLTMDDGDVLRATYESTGSPVLPSRPEWHIEFQRISR